MGIPVALVYDGVVITLSGGNGKVIGIIGTEVDADEVLALAVASEEVDCVCVCVAVGCARAEGCAADDDGGDGMIVCVVLVVVVGGGIVGDVVVTVCVCVGVVVLDMAGVSVVCVVCVCVVCVCVVCVCVVCVCVSADKFGNENEEAIHKILMMFLKKVQICMYVRVCVYVRTCVCVNVCVMCVYVYVCEANRERESERAVQGTLTKAEHPNFEKQSYPPFGVLGSINRHLGGNGAELAESGY